jgi:hypothetical protein
MLPDPRLVEIPQSLLDLVGEDLARDRLILPLRDDGVCIALFCPSHPQYGTYGESIASRIGTILGRKIEWIPVDRDIMAQAVDERFAVVDNCPAQFRRPGLLLIRPRMKRCAIAQLAKATCIGAIASLRLERWQKKVNAWLSPAMMMPMIRILQPSSV